MEKIYLEYSEVRLNYKNEWDNTFRAKIQDDKFKQLFLQIDKLAYELLVKTLKHKDLIRELDDSKHKAWWTPENVVSPEALDAEWETLQATGRANDEIIRKSKNTLYGDYKDFQATCDLLAIKSKDAVLYCLVVIYLENMFDMCTAQKLYEKEVELKKEERDYSNRRLETIQSDRIKGGDNRAKNDPKTQALKAIEEVDYPAAKRVFHLRGWRTKFANDMLVKYKNEGLVSTGTILKLVDRLNKKNGITQKNKNRK
jgi:hypothetical protein